MNVLDKVVGVKEAAEILKLSEGHVKNLCAQGKLEAKKIGKTWVVDKTKLKEFDHWNLTNFINEKGEEIK